MGNSQSVFNGAVSLYHGITGLLSGQPLYVLALILLLLLVAAGGMLVRLNSILRGKGGAMDFLAALVILVMIVVAILMAGSGAVKTLRIY